MRGETRRLIKENEGNPTMQDVRDAIPPSETVHYREEEAIKNEFDKIPHPDSIRDALIERLGTEFQSSDLSLFIDGFYNKFFERAIDNLSGKVDERTLDDLRQHQYNQERLTRIRTTSFLNAEGMTFHPNDCVNVNPETGNTYATDRRLDALERVNDFYDDIRARINGFEDELMASL